MKIYLNLKSFKRANTSSLYVLLSDAVKLPFSDLLYLPSALLVDVIVVKSASENVDYVVRSIDNTTGGIYLANNNDLVLEFKHQNGAVTTDKRAVTNMLSELAMRVFQDGLNIEYGNTVTAIASAVEHWRPNNLFIDVYYKNANVVSAKVALPFSLRQDILTLRMYLVIRSKLYLLQPQLKFQPDPLPSVIKLGCLNIHPHILEQVA